MSTRKKFWIIVLAAQAIGALASPFANVHLNPLALIVAVVFLMPGTAVAGLFHCDTSSWPCLAGWLSAAILCNLVFWGGMFMAVQKLKSRSGR